MKKLYVIELEEITCCKDCPILDDDWGVDYCSFLGINENVIEEPLKKLSNCPLTELKPKQLEWKYDGEKWYATMFADCYISFYQFMSGTSVIDVNDNCIQKHDDKTNGELKQLCQDHYNNLFWEMVGGKK